MKRLAKTEPPQSAYAVLTGDVVGSSRLHPSHLQEIMQKLRDEASRFSKVFPGSVIGQLDVYSGDGWQLLLSDWKRSLRAALFLRAVVKSQEARRLDTRIAVAWGEVNESTLNPERISESTGEAFTESGRALRSMQKRRRLVLHAGESLGHIGLLTSAVTLVDVLASRWTARQAGALAMALLNFRQEDIASRIGKRQPTVNRALQAAGWLGIADFLKDLEYRLEKL